MAFINFKPKKKKLIFNNPFSQKFKKILNNPEIQLPKIIKTDSSGMTDSGGIRP